MLPTKGYATHNSAAKFEPFEFQRREVGPHDVQIQIAYCGICHSDIHIAKNEWQGTQYPVVPGHEIVGTVVSVGAKVTRFKVGDIAGVGCFVDACRACQNCKEHDEQFCEQGASFTYNSFEQDKKTPTYGGYSSHIVTDENFVLRVAPHLPLANVAPLLCAGITTYSPLREFNVGPGQKVGVIGLGGLGHMGVKLAAAMGAEVTVFSTSSSKEKDAYALGAKHFVMTKDPKNFADLNNHFDLILDTVSAQHDLNQYLVLLRKAGVMVLVGVPEQPLALRNFALIDRRRKLSGSLIGGIKQTQEMLDFCAEKNIVAEVEVIPFSKIAEAYERTLKSDVKYRFVLDLKTI